MNRMLTAGAVVLSFALQACNQTEQAGSPAPAASTTAGPPGMPMPAQAPAPGAAGQATTYTTTGEIASVAGDSVTINHQPVAALGWPAMTMSFKAPNTAMLAGISTGTPVEFSFREEGTQHVLTEIKRK
jgi:Cu/Ag efflux protein CusF